MADLEGKRILICEDEGVTHVCLQYAADRAGMGIVGSAVTGDEAVTVALRERPDIILMDIRMPGMDGIEATRQILAEYPACVVMLTAYADEEHQEAAFEAGASGYLVKPISVDALGPALVEALDFHADRMLAAKR